MRNKRHILFLLILLPFITHGQYLSQRQMFQVDEEKGCATFDVTISNTDLKPLDGQCGTCQVFWGDNTNNLIVTNQASHSYSQPGTYTITVRYQSVTPGITNEDTKQIIVTANTQPTFEIYSCTGQQLQVKVTDINYDFYLINYGDGSPETQVPKGSTAIDNHNYFLTLPQPQPDPSTQSIAVRGINSGAADNCISQIKPVDVVNPLAAPVIDLLTVNPTDNTKIDLEYNNTSYSDNVVYKLELATNSGSNFQTAQSYHDVSSITVGSLQADNNYYCFRLGTFNPCTNSITARSNIICSANFDVSAQSNLNKLTWTTSTSSIPNVGNFNIERNGSSIGSPTPANGLTYNDQAVTCNTVYTYQLFTNYPNGSQSISNFQTVTAFSTAVPTAINDVSAIVGNGSVDLEWIQDPAFQTTDYSILRKSGSGSFSNYSSSPSTQFTDEAYTTKGEYCYQINYIDACENVSAIGLEVCPIRLKGKVNNNNTISLHWSEYTGWKNNVQEYIVEKYDDQGNLIQTFNTGTSTTLDDNSVTPTNQVFKFIVKANANDVGLTQAVSNEIEISKDPVIIFPTAFTPNGDGTNDIYKPIIPTNFEFITQFEMKIYNRWGELLFTSSSVEQGWDGKSKGNYQPEGTYVYTCKISDLRGSTFEQTGSFVLLQRK